MGLHLSRTPHLPAHLAPPYPPTSAAARLQRSASVPTRPRPPITQSQSQSHHSRSHSNTPPSPPKRQSRLLPPPTRSALKKPTTTTTSSSVTPDTASASTVASSGPPLTPTRGAGLLARFLGKERGRAAAAGMTLVVPQRTTSKAVRFGGLEEESESA